MPDADALARFPLFEGLPRSELSRLLEYVHERPFPAGANVLIAEQPGEAVYVILSGSFKVDAIRPDGTEVVLAVLGTGEVLGEMSVADLLDGVLQSLGGVPDHRGEGLLEGSRSFAAGVEEDASYRRALELAALVREISHQGEEEHRACRTILEGFAGYLRSRPRADEEAGEGW